MREEKEGWETIESSPYFNENDIFVRSRAHARDGEKGVVFHGNNCLLRRSTVVQSDRRVKRRWHYFRDRDDTLRRLISTAVRALPRPSVLS